MKQLIGFLEISSSCSFAISLLIISLNSQQFTIDPDIENDEKKIISKNYIKPEKNIYSEPTLVDYKVLVFGKGVFPHLPLI